MSSAREREDVRAEVIKEELQRRMLSEYGKPATPLFSAPILTDTTYISSGTSPLGLISAAPPPIKQINADLIDLIWAGQPVNFVESLREKKFRAADRAITALAATFGEVRARRLQAVLADVASEYPNSEIPAAPTIEAYARLIDLIRHLKEPLLTMSRNGAIWCEWRGRPGHRASLSVWENENVSFGMISPDSSKSWARIHMNRAGSMRDVVNEIGFSPDTKWLLA